MRKLILCGILLLGGLTSCVSSQPKVVVITATFEPAAALASTLVANAPTPITQSLSPIPSSPLSFPTPDPTRPPDSINSAREHVVQAGDTLYGIAVAYNITLDNLIAVNALSDPNILSVGQVIQLPGLPAEQTPDFKIIPDSRLVRGPGSGRFDIAAFVAGRPGYIRTATDDVSTRSATGGTYVETLDAAQIIERVSLEYSVDARLLLMLLEYRAGWLSNPNPEENLRSHPLISDEESEGVDRTGLYRQLIWAANELNRGYYDWKYRGVITLDFDGGPRLQFAPGLNAGSVALQYFLSLNSTLDAWNRAVSQAGLYQTYVVYFGDPFADPVDPLVPPGLTQPVLTFPFASGETWFFTGGPHGGWGSGSAWSALDFAPPDDLTDIDSACYQSEYWAAAVAPGLIVRSNQGVVVLDLDGDGDETTGWTILYLHLSADGRVAAGTWVQPGDAVGHPSCEGGFSTATHMHIARRYNGEWIPADCPRCIPGRESPRFVMNEWAINGFSGQEYQGYMTKAEQTVIAEQGRSKPENQISW